MTPSNRDGGPAFPVRATTRQYKDDDGHWHFGPVLKEQDMGMSLRDWFAAKANEEDIRATILKAESLPPEAHGNARVWARYQHADAMLAERRRRQEEEG